LLFHYTREHGSEGCILTGETDAVGVDLATLLGKGRPPLRAALELGAAVADILSIAVQDEIVHGDVKPGNIKVDVTGSVSIEGWGPTRQKCRAPESRPIGPETDVYALGIVLHAIMADDPMGALPRDPDEHDDLVVDKILAMDFGELSSKRWVQDVRQFVALCLAYEPSERPEALDVANVLAHLCERCPEPDMQRWAARLVPQISGDAAPARAVPEPAAEEDLDGPTTTRGPLQTGMFRPQTRTAPAAKGEATSFFTRAKIEAMLAEEDAEADAEPVGRAPAAPPPEPAARPAPAALAPARPVQRAAPQPAAPAPQPAAPQRAAPQPAAPRPQPAAPKPQPQAAPPIQGPIASGPTAGATAPAPAPAKSGGGGKKLVLIAIVFILALGAIGVVGAAVFLLVLNGDGDASSDPAGQVEQPVEQPTEPAARGDTGEEQPEEPAQAAPTSGTRSSGSSSSGSRSSGSSSHGSGSSSGTSRSSAPAAPAAPTEPNPDEEATGGSYTVRFVAQGHEGQLTCGDGQKIEFVSSTRASFTGVVTCMVQIGDAKGVAQLREAKTITCTPDGGKVSCGAN